MSAPDDSGERDYEVCVCVRGYAYITVTADSEDDAKADAVDMWSTSDLQNCEVDEVLIERDGVYS